MKTDGILTVPHYSGYAKLKRSVNRVYNAEGALIGGVSAYSVFDLNGKKIARFTGIIKSSAGDYRRYEGTRTLLVKDNLLLDLGGNVLGTIEKRGRAFSVLLGVMLSLLIAVILIIVIMLGFPVPPEAIPQLVVQTEGADWGVNAQLNVFDGKIFPGRKGSYEFIVENPSEYTLNCTLNLADDMDWGGRSPMNYRLRMDDFMGDAIEWIEMDDAENSLSVTFSINPNSSHTFTVEWEWPFQSGNDAEDTMAGIAAGTYYLNVDVTAVIEGQT